MKAVILAGGEGTRLRPLTCTVPKPMAPILNKPIVDHTMDLLKKHGFTDAVFTLGYLAERIIAHIGDGSEWGIRTQFCRTGTQLGTAGSVRRALESAAADAQEAEQNDSVLVLSGDGITDIDLSELMRAHEKSGAAATIVLKRVDEPTEYGVAVTDGNGFIERFIEKPERSEVFSDYANTGIYVLEREAIGLIPGDTDFDFSRHLFPLMLERGMRIHGFKTEAYWCDVGDIAQYRRAQRDMLEGRLEFKTAAVSENGIFIEPNARIAKSAKLIPPCYIGSGALIEDGAVIGEYSVIGSGSAVERGASIKRSIVLENAHIGVESELREAVVCENAWLEGRASLFSGSVVGAGTHIGMGATILPNAAVWPQKQVETGDAIESSFIWGETARKTEFVGGRVRGHAVRALTPETALRLGAAYASLFKAALPAKLAVCTDGEAVSVTLKHALISGIASQGVEAASVSPLSRAGFSFTAAHSCFDGGIYVRLLEGRGAELIMLDASGCELGTGEMRRLKAAFMLGEKQPALAAEIGLVSSVNGMEEAFEHHLMERVDKALMMENAKTLRISAEKQTVWTLARMLLRLGWSVEEVPERSRLSASSDENTLSVLIDENDMLSLHVGNTTADAQLILTVLAENALERGIRELVLPVSLHEVYKQRLEKKGAKPVYSRAEAPELMREAIRRGLAHPAYESEAAVLELCALFAKGSLEESINALPRVFTRTAEVETSWRDTGRILRTLFDEVRADSPSVVDGLQLKYDTGWVLVKPLRSERAAFRIVAGSFSSEYADELCSLYTDKLKRLKEKGRDKGE